MVIELDAEQTGRDDAQASESMALRDAIALSRQAAEGVRFQPMGYVLDRVYP